MDEYMGIIKLFAGTFAPRGWMFCWGQQLNINDYTALYSLLGTNFGGDGKVNFALPDLRGRVPIGMGRPTWTTNQYIQGHVGGTELTQLTTNQMPPHTHIATFYPTGGNSSPISATVSVNAGTAGQPTNDPTGAYWGKSPSVGPAQSQDYTNTKSVQMAADAVQVSVSGGGGITGGTVVNSVAGSGLPFTNLPPFQVLNYIICIEGLYPPRN